jgi:hypothetical protein
MQSRFERYRDESRIQARAERRWRWAPRLDKRPKFRRTHTQHCFARADRIGRNLHKFRSKPLPLWLRNFFKK